MADDDQQGNAAYSDISNISYPCTAWAPILGFSGIAAAVVFASKLTVRTVGITRLF
jgi:hypothetical protein